MFPVSGRSVEGCAGAGGGLGQLYFMSSFLCFLLKRTIPFKLRPFFHFDFAPNAASLSPDP